MLSTPQFPAVLVSFTNKDLNGKRHILCRTHLRPIFSSSINQSINFLCKPNDWFLYDIKTVR